MSRFTVAEIEAAERLAKKGGVQALALGNVIVRGDNASGYTLTIDGVEHPRKSDTISGAMFRANVNADCATAVPITRA